MHPVFRVIIYFYMGKKMKITNNITIGKSLPMALFFTATISLASCDGMFDGIYDEPDDETANVADAEDVTIEVTDSTGNTITVTGTTSDTGFGFIAYDSSTRRGTIYVNSTDYYTWTYLNAHNLTTDTLIIDLELDDPLADEPEEWDLALHRWDVRTNGGAVLETDYESLDDLEASGEIPSGTYVEDEWYEYVSVDMSGMMSGVIGYMSCYCNLELGKWMDVDTSNMPPTYTPSGKVYMLLNSDGSYMALILSNYMKTGGSTKGYLTIDYIFPYQP